jgi:propanol-preferring alcohol dehydrogenase
MLAMVLERLGEPLRSKDMPDPQPSAAQVRIRVLVCGVCRTDVHIVDGELPDQPLAVKSISDWKNERSRTHLLSCNWVPS